MDSSTVATIVVAVLSVAASGVLTSLFWRWQTQWTRPKLEITGIKEPTTINDRYSVYIFNRKRRYVYDVTVAAQLIIPMDDGTDDRPGTDNILGIPIEFDSKNNFNHIPALGPAGIQQSTSENVGNNRYVFLYFKDLRDPSNRLPQVYDGEWRGDARQVKDLLKHGQPGVQRKPTVMIFVYGYDARTNARQFLKRSYTAADFHFAEELQPATAADYRPDPAVHG